MNSQMKKYIGQDLEGFQAQEPVSLWGASPSWAVNVFTNLETHQMLFSSMYVCMYVCVYVFFISIYLFIWLHWVSVAGGGLLSCGSPAPYLWHAGSLVVACKLLVVACMWDLVPRAGIEPGSPALGARSPNHCATREVPSIVFIALNLQAHLSPFLSQRSVGGTESSNLLIMWSFWWPAPSWGFLGVPP